MSGVLLIKCDQNHLFLRLPGWRGWILQDLCISAQAYVHMHKIIFLGIVKIEQHTNAGVGDADYTEG